ncbi:Uncharacterised protein [Legionella quateirensis]|uniref:Uncharacterized protein n=1 Tax=Legionella quateirensis TaxID=45072 RepID=A0A378KTB8_9GAMM|nr:hypothetical protein [Legionella quateirensis]STY16737.1 Uncharacterised protein [Legionella quateirensis]
MTELKISFNTIIGVSHKSCFIAETTLLPKIKKRFNSIVSKYYKRGNDFLLTKNNNKKKAPKKGAGLSMSI